jgi:hypothetical protein
VFVSSCGQQFDLGAKVGALKQHHAECNEHATAILFEPRLLKARDAIGGQGNASDELAQAIGTDTCSSTSAHTRHVDLRR